MARYHTGSRTIQVMRNVLDPEGNPVLDDSGAPVTVLVNEVEHFHEQFTAEEEAEWDAREAEEAASAIVSQFDLDKARYQKRAAVKDDLIAYMAADNMSRVRAGTWTVPQLVSLMDDPAVAAATAYMGTLSFELAAQAIASAATPLLTEEIRADWIGRLQAHFYL